MPPPELDAYLSRFLLSVRKKSGNEYEPTTLRGIIASVERYLKTYATLSLLSKDNGRQLNCLRGTCLSKFLNLQMRLWISLCVGFDNDHIRVN